MRFDDPAYVQAWQDTGRFPAIHCSIVAMVRSQVDRADPILDLGACTGLLSRQLAVLGFMVCAVERPGPALDLGISSGAYSGIPILDVLIGSDTVDQVVDFTASHRVTTIVARRVFPELSDRLGVDGMAPFVAKLKDAGVRKIFVEGRVKSTKTIHSLGSIQAECAALGVNSVTYYAGTRLAVGTL